jgi:hypothetical protein
MSKRDATFATQWVANVSRLDCGTTAIDDQPIAGPRLTASAAHDVDGALAAVFSRHIVGLSAASWARRHKTTFTGIFWPFVQPMSDIDRPALTGGSPLARFLGGPGPGPAGLAERVLGLPAARLYSRPPSPVVPMLHPPGKGTVALANKGLASEHNRGDQPATKCELPSRWPNVSDTDVGDARRYC